MPIKSRRQWRQIFALVERGEMTEEQAKEMTAGQKYESLPETAKKKSKKKKK